MEIIFSHPFIAIPLMIIIPVILLPLLMRFVVGKIVLSIVKARYLSGYEKELFAGWASDDDRAAMEAARQFALQRLKTHFLLRLDFKTDIRILFLVIKNSYNPDSDPEKEEYHFSLRRLVECFFLAFCDLYKEYASKAWFKAIAGLKLIWFFRIVNISKYYKALFSLPFLTRLQSTRLLGRIMRLVLIPIFGIPVLIYDVVKSILISLVYEGYMRFLYGLLLMKIAYYGLYLYGRENSDISKRIKSIPRSTLNDIHKKVEKMLDPSQYTGFSKKFAESAVTYSDCLREYGFEQDSLFLEDRLTMVEKARNVLNRVRNSFIKAYKKQNPFRRRRNYKEKGLKDHFYDLYYRIGTCYVPGVKEPGLHLRISGLIESGYMTSVLLLNKLLTTPLINTLLDKISGDLVLKVKSFADMDFIKLSGRQAKGAYPYIRLLSVGNRIWRVARGVVSPFSLLLTAGGPVIFQQLQDIVMEYLFHRAGRMLIYTWEKDRTREKTDMECLLWQA
ncbi:MAG: hypothetical protein JW969_13030 [Spirochaetales bacterium]|nr:hypothetical protein [Spirochaetales bacterium]